MSTAKIYTIHYQLHGQPKSFVVRAEVMNNAEAWHWAAVDADIAHVSRIGRVGHEQVKKNHPPLGGEVRHYRGHLGSAQVSTSTQANAPPPRG